MGREEGSGRGTHVCLWRIHFDIWQNQYNIVKFKNKIKFKKNDTDRWFAPRFYNCSQTGPYVTLQGLSSVQSLSRGRLFAAPWMAARQASLSNTNSRSSLRLMSVESVMPSSHLILCRPLLLLPPIPPSIRRFSNGSTLHMRWQKYWSFSFSIIPSKEIPGPISFRMDWLDLHAVQGTLKRDPRWLFIQGIKDWHEY